MLQWPEITPVGGFCHGEAGELNVARWMAICALPGPEKTTLRTVDSVSPDAGALIVDVFDASAVTVFASISLPLPSIKSTVYVPAVVAKNSICAPPTGLSKSKLIGRSVHWSALPGKPVVRRLASPSALTRTIAPSQPLAELAPTWKPQTLNSSPFKSRLSSSGVPSGRREKSTVSGAVTLTGGLTRKLLKKLFSGMLLS